MVSARSQLKHPHIVRYEARILDREQKKVFIVMEYCARGDLSKMIRERRKTHNYFDEVCAFVKSPLKQV